MYSITFIGRDVKSEIFLAPWKANMQVKTKTEADRKAIKDLFGCDPVSWARYPDGRLVFISPTGQKFGYTREEFDNIQEAVKHERAGKKKLSRKKPAAKAEKEKLPEPEPTSSNDWRGRSG